MASCLLDWLELSQAGHKTGVMFDRYNTIDEEDARDALQRLNGFIEGQGRAALEAEECSHSAPVKVHEMGGN